MSARTDPIDLIARGARQVPLLAEPVAFDLHLEPTLDDRVASKLRERALRKLVDLQANRGLDFSTMMLGVGNRPLTCAATLYSSSNGSLVKWNWSGSSVLKLTLSPILKKSGNGLRSYVKKSELLLSGLIAMPICFR